MQPNEAVCMKRNVKSRGFTAKHIQTELEVNYDTRFFAHQKEANPGKLVFNAIGYLFDHGEYCVF